MNKSEAVELIAKKTNLSKKAISDVVEMLIGTVKSQLVAGRKVTLTGFGTFTLTHRAARNGVNPQTGKPIRIPATKVPRFKAGKDLRALIK